MYKSERTLLRAIAHFKINTKKKSKFHTIFVQGRVVHTILNVKHLSTFILFN